MTEAEADEFTQINTAIGDYLKENTARYVFGDRDIDKEWDNYVKELKNKRRTVPQ